MIEPVPGDGTGLLGRYFNNIDFSVYVGQRIDLTVSFNWGTGSPFPGANDCTTYGSCAGYSVRWKGQVRAIRTGMHRIQIGSDDGARVWVDGKKVVDQWYPHNFIYGTSDSIYMVAGKKYDIQVDYFNGAACCAEVRLRWSYPGQSTFQIIPSTQLYPSVRPDTVGIWRPSNKTFYLRNSNSTGNADIEATLSFALADDLPIIGDWNGDGIDTIGLFRPTNATFYLLNSNRTASAADLIIDSGVAPSPNLVPISGRWMGAMNYDGVGVFNKSNGVYYTKIELATSGTATPAGSWGNPSSTGFAGSWLADNISYIGTFQLSNAGWWLVGSSPFTFGLANDAPIVGNWAGSQTLNVGTDGIGVYRGDRFYLKYPPLPPSTPYANLDFQYGVSGDVPVAGRWQPTANACTVTKFNYISQLHFRIQPSLATNPNDPNGDNWLIPVSYLGTPGSYNASTPYPTRPYLWPTPTIPSSFTITQIDIVAKIGVIPWVDANIQWAQVRIVGAIGVNPITLDGYLQYTTTAGASQVILQTSSSCAALDYPAPDPAVTKVPTAAFNVPTVASIFGTNVPPAVMGNCYLHDGSTGGQGCSANSSFSTIDLMPANIEFCIDTKPANRLGECDPPTPTGGGTVRISVYSPVQGCAILDPITASVVIEHDPLNRGYLNGCNYTAIQQFSNAGNIRYQVTYVHLFGTQIPSGNYMAVVPGTKIGEVCTRAQWTSATVVCAGSLGLVATAPQHIAVHLRTFQNGNFSEQPGSVRGFLAHPYCLSDKWKGLNNGTPVAQSPQSTPIQYLPACPQ